MENINVYLCVCERESVNRMYGRLQPRTSLSSHQKFYICGWQGTRRRGLDLPAKPKREKERDSNNKKKTPTNRISLKNYRELGQNSQKTEYM